MQPKSRLGTLPATGLIALLSLLPCAQTAWSQEATCDDVADRGHLNILTINLLFSEVENRDQRLTAIAQFIAPGETNGEEPRADIVLLQEVVGGRLVRTANSAGDLQRKLLDRGFAFERRTAVEFGLPGLLVVANATLSRCDILFRAVEVLPPAAEFEIAGEAIELPRNVLLTRIEVPDFGAVDVYNTHLCAFCPPEQRREQLEELLDFVDDIEDFLPGEAPVVLGGDFNIDVFESAAQGALYGRVVGPGRFIDAYAASVPEDLDDLCDPDGEPFPDEHCTYGVTPLGDPDFGRIDYIFIKDFGPVLDATVLFNTLIDGEPTVSDHAGVLVSVALPGEEFPMATREGGP